MTLDNFKEFFSDRYKFTADYDLDAVRKAIYENNREFAGEVPYVLEAGCVNIEVEILDDDGRVYADYNICVKIDDDEWRTFDSLADEVDFDVPDMEAEMSRILDEYVTKNNLTYTQYNGRQFTEKMRAFETPSDVQTPTLANLMQGRLEDVHFCHCDEEIELATVVELDSNTLTEKGKADWADVLNAKVQRIYEGSYGTQIDLSDVDPSRLSDFSFMLAGQCSAAKYDEWVADISSQSPKPDMNM